jgi:hypothetical protein
MRDHLMGWQGLSVLIADREPHPRKPILGPVPMTSAQGERLTAFEKGDHSPKEPVRIRCACGQMGAFGVTHRTSACERKVGSEPEEPRPFWTASLCECHDNHVPCLHCEECDAHTAGIHPWKNTDWYEGKPPVDGVYKGWYVRGGPDEAGMIEELKEVSKRGGGWEFLVKNGCHGNEPDVGVRHFWKPAW